jgi:hypothetical protein
MVIGIDERLRPVGPHSYLSGYGLIMEPTTISEERGFGAGETNALPV